MYLWLLRNWKPLAAVAVVLALVGGVLWWANDKAAKAAASATQAADLRWEGAVSKLKLQASAELSAANQRAADVTLRLNELRNEQEKKDANNVKTIGDLRLAIAIERRGTGGRLRDPNAEAPGCGSGGQNQPAASDPTANGGRADAPQAGQLLSVQLTDLLDRLLYEADEQSVAYTSCRADSQALRLQLDNYRKAVAP